MSREKIAKTIKQVPRRTITYGCAGIGKSTLSANLVAGWTIYLAGDEGRELKKEGSRFEMHVADCEFSVLDETESRGL